MSLWSETMRLRDMYCDVKKQLIEATSTNVEKDLKSLDKEYLEIGRICETEYYKENPLITFEDLDYAEQLRMLSYK